MDTKKFFSYVLPVIAVTIVSFGTSNTSSSNHLCTHTFALCTSAACIPQPGDPDKAICFCDVEEGTSLATVPCERLKPTKDGHGINTVYSTFSLKQATDGKLSMKCPSGTPWTWCLNKKCTIDPANPKKAICTCDVRRTGQWTTMGGNCDTNTCKTGYWSGATLKDEEDGAAYLMKALSLQANPIKWCPATK